MSIFRRLLRRYLPRLAARLDLRDIDLSALLRPKPGAVPTIGINWGTPVTVFWAHGQITEAEAARWADDGGRCV